MSYSRLVWVGGLAAMIGGLMWIIKGVIPNPVEKCLDVMPPPGATNGSW